MLNITTIRSAVTVFVLATSVFALSACTGAGSESGSEASAPTAASNQPDTVPTFVGVQGEVIPAEDIKNDPELYGAVALTDCTATDSGWLATGTAVNSASSAQDYVIVVNVTDAQARAITSVVVDVIAEAGETAQWEAPAAIEAPADSACVVAGVSGG